jgi:hypothetical protein
LRIHRSARGSARCPTALAAQFSRAAAGAPAALHCARAACRARQRHTAPCRAVAVRPASRAAPSAIVRVGIEIDAHGAATRLPRRAETRGTAARRRHIALVPSLGTLLWPAAERERRKKRPKPGFYELSPHRASIVAAPGGLRNQEFAASPCLKRSTSCTADSPAQSQYLVSTQLEISSQVSDSP